jgi:hypothetical protein
MPPLTVNVATKCRHVVAFGWNIVPKTDMPRRPEGDTKSSVRVRLFAKENNDL